MARFVEYYEVAVTNGYDYYFMPVDKDAGNKQNLDNVSQRIWKVDVKTSRFEEIINRRKDKTPVTKIELFTIQLSAKPVPWDETYLMVQEVKRKREQRSQP